MKGREGLFLINPSITIRGFVKEHIYLIYESKEETFSS